jgi:hypothetical protein
MSEIRHRQHELWQMHEQSKTLVRRQEIVPHRERMQVGVLGWRGCGRAAGLWGAHGCTGGCALGWCAQCLALRTAGPVAPMSLRRCAGSSVSRAGSVSTRILTGSAFGHKLLQTLSPAVLHGAHHTTAAQPYPVCSTLQETVNEVNGLAHRVKNEIQLLLQILTHSPAVLYHCCWPFESCRRRSTRSTDWRTG